MSRKALVVLSGGQDSTTCLFWAKEMFSEVHAITFDYGQRHEREIQAARNVALLADVASHEVVTVPNVLKGRSPLVSKHEPLERYENYEAMDRIIGDRVELTFVPMRNALFFVLAANRAICMDIRDLVTGICQADNANYPDCRETFRHSIEDSINLALGIENFHIHAPLMDLSKEESILMANTFPGCMAALAFSHTSYNGEYPPTDKNHANVLRAHGFYEAGMPDPLIVRAAWIDEVMAKPTAKNYEVVSTQLVADIMHDGERLMVGGPR